MSSFGLDGARALAAESHAKARAALADGRRRRSRPSSSRITDFIFKRTS